MAVERKRKANNVIKSVGTAMPREEIQMLLNELHRNPDSKDVVSSLLEERLAIIKKQSLKVHNCNKLGLSVDVPDGILHDAMIDAGLSK